MKVRFPWNTGYFLTSWATVSLWSCSYLSETIMWAVSTVWSNSKSIRKVINCVKSLIEIYSVKPLSWCIRSPLHYVQWPGPNRAFHVFASLAEGDKVHIEFTQRATCCITARKFCLEYPVARLTPVDLLVMNFEWTSNARLRSGHYVTFACQSAGNGSITHPCT